MATYVLVHGGGHGGWCYQPVAKLLRQGGHEVHAPTLTGLADRRHQLHPGIDLDAHILDVVNLIFYEDLSDVILVGHSYGGMVITGAADRAIERIAQLVYLDAAIPVDGESLLDVSPGLATFQTLNKTIDGVELGLLPESVSIKLYGIDDPDLSAWVMPRLTPHPWRTFTQPLRLTNAALVTAIPRTIINCKATLAARDPRTRSRWLAADHVWNVDTGHDLMLLEPELVAKLLLRLAEPGRPGG